MDLIPASAGSPQGGHGNPGQYSYLENPLDRRAWPATVHGIAKSQSQLKRLSTYMHRTWLNVISRLSVLSWRQKRRVRDWSREGGRGHLATRGRNPSPRSPICRVHSEKVWCDSCPPSTQKQPGLGLGWFSDPQVG